MGVDCAHSSGIKSRSTVTVYEKTSNLTLIGGTLTNATPSVFHQPYIGRVPIAGGALSSGQIDPDDSKVVDRRVREVRVRADRENPGYYAALRRRAGRLVCQAVRQQGELTSALSYPCQCAYIRSRKYRDSLIRTSATSNERERRKTSNP